MMDEVHRAEVAALRERVRELELKLAEAQRTGLLEGARFGRAWLASCEWVAARAAIEQLLHAMEATAWVAGFSDDRAPHAGPGGAGANDPGGVGARVGDPETR